MALGQGVSVRAGVQLCVGASIGEQGCDGGVVQAGLDSTLEDKVVFLRQEKKHS